MNDELDIVEQDPVRCAATLDTGGLASQCPAEPLLDVIRDRRNLSIRISVANDEVVGDVADAAKIENDQILGLPVQCGAGAFGDLRRKLAAQRNSSCKYNPLS